MRRSKNPAELRDLRAGAAPIAVLLLVTALSALPNAACPGSEEPSSPSPDALVTPPLGDEPTPWATPTPYPTPEADYLVDEVEPNDNGSFSVPPEGCQDIGELPAEPSVLAIHGNLSDVAPSHGGDTDSYCFTVGVEGGLCFLLEWTDPDSDLDARLLGNTSGNWFSLDGWGGMSENNPEGDCSSVPLEADGTYAFQVSAWSGNPTDYIARLRIYPDEP